MTHEFMKRLLSSLLLIIAPIVAALGEEMRVTYQIEHDIADFDIDRDNLGRLSFSSDRFVLGFGNDTNKPGLPSKAVAVALPADSRFISCIFVPTSRILIDSDAYVLPNPRVFPIGTPVLNDTLHMPNYGTGRYPEIQLAHTHDVYTDNATISYLSYCPFEYDAATRDLNFISNGELTVIYTDGLDEKSIKTRIYKEDEEYYSRTVLGYSDFMPLIEPYDLGNDQISISAISDVEYLIITNESLKQSFRKLADWKTVKGVATEVVTVEDIYGGASNDRPLMIKKYLINRYNKSKKLRYVLLGGDDTVVPVRYCYGGVMPDSAVSLVTDLYYACLSGMYDWDSNGNGVYGEPDDNINLSIQLNVSRLPVRTETHVRDYLKKLIKYEGPQAPDDYNVTAEGNKFLMCGSRLNPLVGSDVMINTLSLSVDSLWNGEIVSFSNENINFQTGENCELTNDILDTQLRHGYRFMNMFSHGTPKGWELGNDELYSIDYASNVKSNSSLIISTIACHTNAFDSRTYYNLDGTSYNSEPCLSEAFIRNPDSGVIAYLGASNEGLGRGSRIKGTSGYGASFIYEQKFYETLFSNTYGNFSKIVSAVKNDAIGGVYTGNEINDNRWVHFCLNPVGDAEVPIFTDDPKYQGEPSISLSLDKNTLLVTTESDACRIAISGASDFGKTYYGVSEKGCASFSGFDISKPVYLCISRPGYRPLLYYGMPNSKGWSGYKFKQCYTFPYADTSAQSMGEIESHILNGERLEIACYVTGDFDNVEIRCMNSDGTLVDISKVNKKDETESVSLSVQSGVNIVSLIGDGEVLDSITVIR